ncbi:MAG: lytic transglycosylase domain-containing protein [Leptothrix sp. (in: b-proteobacteria)]
MAMLLIGSGSAQAQVFVSASTGDAADEQTPLVLSNFSSADTPVLLMEAPVVVAPPVDANNTTAASGKTSLVGSTASALAQVTGLGGLIDTPVAFIAAPAGAPAVPLHLLPLFAATAREQSVPASLLMAVAAVESGFNSRAMSPKGALGLMQLMPDTARQHGVRQVWSVSENLRGGAAHLRGLLVRFAGQTSLALAAYNAGEQAVLKAGRRIPDFDETQRYVPKVLAWVQQYERLLDVRAAASQLARVPLANRPAASRASAYTHITQP